MKKPLELILLGSLALILSASGSLGRSAGSAYAQSNGSGSSSPTLDYGYFKTRVEPIFLKKRPTHARCYACHEEANHPFKLAKLSAGNSTWTEEESRRNFEKVSSLVTPGDPIGSMLLHHPLAPEAGGDAFHSGGRQFETQNDPDWVTIADWVKGAKANQ